LFNKKNKKSLFLNKKEQDYLKSLIDKVNNEQIMPLSVLDLNELYKNFENISSIEEAENFLKKYPFIKVDLDSLDLNDLKEKIAYEINEMILTKYL